jgi:hypothetical protein
VNNTMNGMPLKLWNITMSFLVAQLQPKDLWGVSFIKHLQFEMECLKLYFINDPTIWQYFCKSNNVHINAKFWVVFLVGRSTTHKLFQGENTLRWPRLGCHMVLLFKDVHVWMYPTFKFWKNFTIFLHIILEYKWVCLDIMWLIWNFSFQKKSYFNKDMINFGK